MAQSEMFQYPDEFDLVATPGDEEICEEIRNKDSALAEGEPDNNVNYWEEHHKTLTTVL